MEIKKLLTKELVTPIAQVFGSQMLGKAVGFIVSILLIRELSKEDYAIYTVLITIQGMLIPLCNSAIFIGFKKIGGTVWQDSAKMSNLIKTTNSIAPYITGLAYFLVSTYAGYILYEQEISWIRILGFLFIILIVILPEVKTAFLRSALLLRNKVAPVQVSELVGHFTRAIGILALLFLLDRSYIIIAIFIITALSGWLTLFYVEKKAKQEGISKIAEINDSYRKTLINYIKLNWHNSAFFAFKGQISIFLIGIFGTTTSLADIGALTRFSLIFMIATAIFNNIFAPDFGKTKDTSKLKRMFLLSLGGALLISSATTLFVYFFPEPFLWILGDNYHNLSHELFLTFVSASLGFILNIVYSLNLYKAWIRFTPLLEIPSDIIAIILGLFLFDISSLKGVLYLGIFTASINLILHLSNAFYGIKFNNKVS
ncbi:lipopolysaccharide biosynthesis protein [Autumnicola psychrophila]|uniref:Membrane protein involved in the export of O-antigen and teichoic acid n=1 Tax=Autumnicola psychrophila TaxID=3075592 RepID=A0ABU3DQR7_9FLAO|nr:hypothetical protein [Zunongwangia sp. F225]MDT0686060.1 hypothetical protein [Zunongwangia sp. F225]